MPFKKHALPFLQVVLCHWKIISNIQHCSIIFLFTLISFSCFGLNLHMREQREDRKKWKKTARVYTVVSINRYHVGFLIFQYELPCYYFCHTELACGIPHPWPQLNSCLLQCKCGDSLVVPWLRGGWDVRDPCLLCLLLWESGVLYY